MSLTALTNKIKNEEDIKCENINNILNIGNFVRNNISYGFKKNIDFVSFIKSKTLLMFNDNLCVKQMVNSSYNKIPQDNCVVIGNGAIIMPAPVINKIVNELDVWEAIEW